MEFAAQELADLAQKQLMRRMRVVSSARGTRVTIEGKEYLSFASNDYLGLAQQPALREAVCRALEQDGLFGAGASRLISGTTARHVALEEAIRDFKGCEAALVFASGYAANLGVITSLADSSSFIAADALNHASLVDACRLSRATVHVYQHCDYKEASRALSQARGFKRKLFVTDSVFSMDGDIAPLPDAVDCARRNNAVLVIDDAHGTGVLGENGRGAAEYFDVEKDVKVLIGTLSKALGCIGGFVCSDAETVQLIANRSRTFMYTTALPPSFCAAAEKSLQLVRHGGELRRRLRANVRRLRAAIADRLPKTEARAETENHAEDGVKTDSVSTSSCHDGKPRSRGTHDMPVSPIVPVVVGDEKRVLEVFEGLQADGIFVPAIRPPTVPVGTCRLRISVSALHTEADIEALLASLGRQGVV
jgi:8-amino-7-oxononanoate synthase